MELREIKLIIDLMKKNDLALFQLEREGFKITLQRNIAAPGGYSVTHVPTATEAIAATQALPTASAAAPAAAPVADASLREIVSPMVGTFYQSASPESPPFVQVGQEINENTVVCIIEAMKVMNEIKAEMRGVVTEVLAENGKPVQFGQALFKVK